MSTDDDFKALGNNCMKSHDYEAAVQNYKRGLALDPKNPILNCNIAQAYLKLNEYVEADKYAKTAIEHQPHYIKAYYRAAKAALGTHNVYESMSCLAGGVEKCLQCPPKELEELFLMARELSAEFENELRKFRERELAKMKNTTSSDAAQSSKPKSAGSDVAKSDTSGIPERENFDRLKEEKLKQHQNKQKEIEEQEKILEKKKQEINAELARELKELEDLKKNEKIEQERAEKKRKEFERRELERQEQERKEQERKERERKEREQKEHERKEQERKEIEKRELERKEQERQKKEDRERKERERKELERKVWEKKEQEKKALQLKLLQQEEEKKRLEEGLKLKLKLEEEHFMRCQNETYLQMKEGSLALLKGLSRKAADSFRKALETLHTPESFATAGLSDPMDVVLLNFSFSQSLIFSDEYKDIVKAIQLLENLEKERWHIKLPAIFLALGRGFMKLNRFKNALLPLQRGIYFLERGSSFSRYSWPGTDEVIELSDRDFLKSALEREMQICKLYHKPDAVCYYDCCLSNSQHIVPSCNIYFSDPDFVGFVNLICQERCHIYFHSSCWKDFKSTVSEIEKLSEKDFLGRNCLTPNCVKRGSAQPSPILKVIIVGPDGEEKSSCERAPSPCPSTVLKKECEVSHTPKKKIRRKENDKSEHNTFKRIRQISNSQVEARSTALEQSMDGQQYKDALNKFAAARELNFGYGSEAPDPFKISSAEPCKLGENEEFVYSYFHEIFKKEGIMPIFKLQEHWETSKELLPVLEPALVTHTDLIKFLLDTDGFNLVQDLIGLATDLPKISSIIESSAEAPVAVEYQWKPSPATILEASKTLSFTSCSNDLETEIEATLLKPQEDSGCLNGTSDHYSTAEDGNSTGCSSYDSVLTGPNYNIDSHKILNSEENIPVQSLYDNSGISSTENKPVLFLNGTLEQNPRDVNAHNVKQSFLKKDHNENSVHQDCRASSSSSDSIHKPQLDSNLTPKRSSPEHVCKEETGLINNNETHSVVAKQLGVSTGNSKPDPPAALKTSWKVRPKLLEWASQTFPSESKEKLWKALTLVRAENNYSLSGLSYPVIKERLSAALPSLDSADI